MAVCCWLRYYLLLLLLLRSCCCLSVQNVIFNGACICLSSGLYYIYDENPSAIPILNILPYSLTFRPKTATTKAPMSTEQWALCSIHNLRMPSCSPYVVVFFIVGLFQVLYSNFCSLFKKISETNKKTFKYDYCLHDTKQQLQIKKCPPFAPL